MVHIDQRTYELLFIGLGRPAVVWDRGSQWDECWNVSSAEQHRVQMNRIGLQGYNGMVPHEHSEQDLTRLQLTLREVFW